MLKLGKGRDEMKLSVMGKDELKKLTVEQKTSIVFGDFTDDGAKSDVAILLGCDLEEMRERAVAAAKLYKCGRVKYIMPTGGVLRDDGARKISEADFLAEVLAENGVPREAIIIENEARTTKENMIYASLQINRVLRIENVKSVTIVTSPSHIRRSMALAGLFLPRNLEIFGYISESARANREAWFLHDDVAKQIGAEIGLMKDLIDAGLIDDVEF